jgi:hypothetical protein
MAQLNAYSFNPRARGGRDCTFQQHNKNRVNLAVTRLPKQWKVNLMSILLRLQDSALFSNS